MILARKLRRRNPVARTLRQPQFKKRVVKLAIGYQRKPRRQSPQGRPHDDDAT